MMRRISVKDISKALKMRYMANISLREIAIATKLPHTTIADYCKRFDNSGYNLDVLLSFGDDKIISILFPNKKIIQKNLENSLMLVTALNPHIGYENSAMIAKKAHKEGLTLRQAAVGSGLVTDEQFTEWVDPRKMV